MYKRSTAKIIEVSEDLLYVRIKLPLSYKNKNYVNSIFGGSLFSAVDPIPMIQLLSIMGNEYVVWDKSAEIFFKKPAKENLYANFNFTEKELTEIREQVAENKEIDIIKITKLTNKDKTQVFCEVKKTIYIADKEYFKQKRKKKSVASA
jgi:5-bromo-4-chloroindolyl phosphate hydrolysis protein